MNSTARKLRRAAAARISGRRRPARIFRVTASSFHSDEETGQLLEYEMYFSTTKPARTLADIRRIRTKLTEKVRTHYRAWLLRHMGVRVGKVNVNFEPEYRAPKQVEQQYALVKRFVLRRIDRKWQARELQSGKMRFTTKRRARHGRK